MSEPASQDIGQEILKQDEAVSRLMTSAIKSYQETQTIPDDVLKDISKYDPRAFAQSVFNAPPSVEVNAQVLQPKLDIIPPSSTEIEYSQKDMSRISGANDYETKSLQIHIQTFKDYLSLPVIDDGFTHHRGPGGRWEWQQPVVQVLNILGDKIKNDKAAYSRPFADLWDSHKSSSSKLNGLLFSLTNMPDLEAGADYQKEVSELTQKLQTEFKSTNENRTHEQIDRVSEIAEESLDLIAKYFTK